MRRLYSLLFALAFIQTGRVSCQEVSYIPGYQTIIVNNPAFAGSSQDATMRISYLNFYPGNHYNYHSFFLSYDSYIPVINGGAGFYIANDYLGGIVNDLRSGFSYSYFLQAGRELFINAGLSASLFHRGFNLGNAIFPDQIDPMGRVSLPSSEILSNRSATLFDVGTGFMFFYRKFTGGFAITHLTQPDMNRSGSSPERLKRKYTVHFLAELDLNRQRELKLQPLVTAELQGDYFYAGAGAVLLYNYLSASTVILADNYNKIDIQAGFSIRRDRLTLYYNYRFNLGPGNTVAPFSLMHQTGLTFSLNNVKKRIKFSTINLPVM
jgi:type IX secretion system PorP/SprF family membrane protein